MGLPRLATLLEVDEAFARNPFDLLRVAFYSTSSPNLGFDISATHQKKHTAIDQYHAQFKQEDMHMLQMNSLAF